jgi:hypothetical protein
MGAALRLLGRALAAPALAAERWLDPRPPRPLFVPSDMPGADWREPVDPLAELAATVAAATERGQQLAVILLDLPQLGDEQRGRLLALTRARLRRRDLVAELDDALLVARRARFAARDADALAAQVAWLLALIMGADVAPPAYGVARHPGELPEAAALLARARAGLEAGRMAGRRAA